MAFSPTSWVARDRKAVERFFQDLAGPTGMVDRVDVPLDTVRVPDFATPLRVWTRAITGALLVSYRIRATPPATVRIRLNVDETPLPVAVDVRVSRGDGGGRLDRFKSWGQVALLVFFFAATVLQWLSVRKMAHIIMRKNRQEDKQATTAPRGDQAG